MAATWGVREKKQELGSGPVGTDARVPRDIGPSSVVLLHPCIMGRLPILGGGRPTTARGRTNTNAGNKRSFSITKSDNTIAISHKKQRDMG